MKIVTSGREYADIDGYGAVVAYTELLKLQGEEAMAVITPELNISVTDTIRSWPVEVEREYEAQADDVFVVLDVSNPEAMDKVVDLNRVEEVVDHHPGHEEYWQARPDVKYEMEMIGAVCTLIYEKWAATGGVERMSQTSARLLMSGILDNTLNFEAKVTSERDRVAFDELAKIAGLGDKYAGEYFSEVQGEIVRDLKKAALSDLKFWEFRTLAGEIGADQLTLWDASVLLESRRDELVKLLDDVAERWILNLVSISEKRSYFVSNSDEAIAWMEDLLGVKFVDGVAVTDRLYLRKEILKADVERARG